MVSEGAPNRLLVEGKDDKFSIISLTARHGVDWDRPATALPFIQDCSGVENLLDAASVAIKSHRVVGFVLDADLEPQDRWQSLRDHLVGSGVTLPQTPESGGVIVADEVGYRRVGVWLMPNNAHAGALEHFLATLVPAADQLFAHAERATGDAVKLGASFASAHQRKAEVHAWLAWQTTPGRPLGQAITAAYLDANGPSAVAFVGWFRRLFAL